jgi:hypothetical protein
MNPQVSRFGQPMMAQNNTFNTISKSKYDKLNAKVMKKGITTIKSSQKEPQIYVRAIFTLFFIKFPRS